MSNDKLDEACKRNGIQTPDEQPWSWQDAVYWIVVLAGVFSGFAFVMSFVGAWN